MPNRLRLLQAATALLYLGPLLAGLAGQGWSTIPVFAAIFVLWSVILRPHLWPARLVDLARGEALVAVASLVATQLLLVVLSFALARGIGGVMGLRLALPFWLPVALSFLSVPLSRLVWNPSVRAEAGFDPLQHRPGPVVTLAPDALARELVAELAALTELPDDDRLQAHLAAIATHVDAALIRAALQQVQPASTLRRVLILHATDPATALHLRGTAYPAEAFLAAGQDTALLTLFARRCLAMVGHAPDLAPDCPTVAQVTAAAQTAPSDTRAALLALTAVLR